MDSQPAIVNVLMPQFFGRKAVMELNICRT